MSKLHSDGLLIGSSFVVEGEDGEDGDTVFTFPGITYQEPVVVDGSSLSKTEPSITIFIDGENDQEDFDPADVPDEYDDSEAGSGVTPWDLSFLAEPEVIPLWKGSDAWKTLWDVDEGIDPCMAAADTYLLFGIANNSFVEIVKKYYPTENEIRQAGELLGETEESIADRIAEIQALERNDPTEKLEAMNVEADKAFRDLVNELDASFRQYVHLACGGELRWSKAMKKDNNYSGNRRTAWGQWKLIYEKYGPSALLQMSSLFKEFTGGSYGGPRWADAAEILHARETGALGPDDFTNKQIFVDRVFTLEHNGGCFLNKLSWTNRRKGREGADREFFHMKNNVLKAHCSNPVDIRTLYNHASPEVQKLLKSYLDLAVEYGLEVVGTWIEQTPVQSKPVATTSDEEIEYIDWSDVEDE